MVQAAVVAETGAEAEAAAPDQAAAAETQPKDQQTRAASNKPLRSSCPAQPAAHKEVMPTQQGRQSRRHSTGQGLLPSGKAAPVLAGSADSPKGQGDTAAGQDFSPAVGQVPNRRVSFAEGKQSKGRPQAAADADSPAEAKEGNQAASKAQRQADQQQGRASLNSPGSGSGGPRQHRRASLGGGGVLPLAGHSFLLTGYAEDKQKKLVVQRITALGGHVLEDIPKPQVPMKEHLHSEHQLYLSWQHSQYRLACANCCDVQRLALSTQSNITSAAVSACAVKC